MADPNDKFWIVNVTDEAGGTGATCTIARTETGLQNAERSGYLCWLLEQLDDGDFTDWVAEAIDESEG